MRDEVQLGLRIARHSCWARIETALTAVTRAVCSGIARHSCWARIETRQKPCMVKSSLGSPGIHAGRGLKPIQLSGITYILPDRPAFMLGAD
ncbi:MAG: hypothetical protein GZ093_06120 [Rhodoferax sp.]|nr:hypothetical protein [Rhodoferax sp.]